MEAHVRTHLAESCSVEGITGARRYAPNRRRGALRRDPPTRLRRRDAAVDRLRALGASGTMSSLQDLVVTTPPIPKVYRESGSYLR